MWSMGKNKLICLLLFTEDNNEMFILLYKWKWNQIGQN